MEIMLRIRTDVKKGADLDEGTAVDVAGAGSQRSAWITLWWTQTGDMETKKANRNTGK